MSNEMNQCRTPERFSYHLRRHNEETEMGWLRLFVIAIPHKWWSWGCWKAANDLKYYVIFKLLRRAREEDR